MMKKVLSLFLLASLLLACRLFQAAPTPTITATAPTSTASPTPTTTPTLTPSPTPAAPLNPDGPWLVFQPSSGDPLGGEEVVLTNLDGSGITHLPLPPLFEDLVISPDGLHAAVRETDPALDPTTQALEARLWIITLPEGNVVRQVPLVGQQAAEWLSANGAAASGLISTILGAPYLWSPDGQYLAFSGALDGESSDLYLYQLDEDQLIQLTDGSKQTVIHSWSPESRWIIHEASMFYQPQDRVIYATWAAAVDGEVNRLTYGPFNQHPIIGWLSPEELLTYTRRTTGSSEELRVVNLLTGRTEFIYNQPFSEAAYDPLSGTILVSLQPADYASADSLPGIYTFNEETTALELLLPGRFSELLWQPATRNFSAVQDQTEMIWFNAAGRLFCSIPFGQGSQLSLSPDGEWMAVIASNSAQIYSADCQPAAALSHLDQVLWLPDSSGVLLIHRSEAAQGSITRCLSENGWRRELFADGLPWFGAASLVAP